MLTSNPDNISPTLLCRIAPLTPRVTILSGGGGTRRCCCCCDDGDDRFIILSLLGTTFSDGEEASCFTNLVMEILR